MKTTKLPLTKNQDEQKKGSIGPRMTYFIYKYCKYTNIVS